MIDSLSTSQIFLMQVMQQSHLAVLP